MQRVVTVADAGFFSGLVGAKTLVASHTVGAAPTEEDTKPLHPYVYKRETACGIIIDVDDRCYERGDRVKAFVADCEAAARRLPKNAVAAILDWGHPALVSHLFASRADGGVDLVDVIVNAPRSAETTRGPVRAGNAGHVTRMANRLVAVALGESVSPAPDAQLPFVAARCKAAAALWKAAAKKPKILTLSAGTAHVPQLLDARGSVVFEATASAAVIINEGVDAADVFLETTSFDTIGNAFYSRNDHCSLAGWRRLLVITSEFHLARTKAIFDWVYGAAGAEPSGAYELSYLGTEDTGLTPAEVNARKAREDASTRNVVSSLAPGHRKLSSVREFLTTRHDLYSAKGLVARAARLSLIHI